MGTPRTAQEGQPGPPLAQPSPPGLQGLKRTAGLQENLSNGVRAGEKRQNDCKFRQGNSAMNPAHLSRTPPPAPRPAWEDN